MRLSEAIRLGAMTGPQGFGMLNNGDATCVLGAAYLAGGFVSELDLYAEAVLDYMMMGNLNPGWAMDLIHWHFPIFAREPSLMSVMVSMNDVALKTREQIADYVEEREIALGYFIPESISCHEQVEELAEVLVNA